MVAPLIPVVTTAVFTGTAYLWHKYTNGRGGGESTGGGGGNVVVSGAVPSGYGAQQSGSVQATETQGPNWEALFKPVIDVLSTPLVLPTAANTAQSTSTNSATVTPATTTPATTTPAPTPATTTPATTTPATTTPATTTPATTTPMPAGQVSEAPTTNPVTSSAKGPSIGNILFNPIAALFGGGGGKITTEAVFNPTRVVGPSSAPVQPTGAGRADIMNSGGMPDRKMTLGFRPVTQQPSYEAQPPTTPFGFSKTPQQQGEGFFGITGNSSSPLRRNTLVRT
jgi:hypothetical protein